MKQHGFGKDINKDYSLIIKARPYDTLMRERQAKEINTFGGKNLIEFGCGSGEATKQIIKYNPKLKILATGNDSNVIKNAKNNIKFDIVEFQL
jgi:trans-aconitate methyltransferase